MTIRQPVLNSMKKAGINMEIIQRLSERTDTVTVENRFGGGSCDTHPLLSYLIDWVYQTSNAYEMGVQDVKISDFDRIKYFVLEQDSNAYTTCLD